MKLLEELARLGVEARLDPPDRVVLRAPRGVLTVELVAELRQRKADLLAELRACCPSCDERRRRPDPLGDGCLTHAISAEAVGERWAGVGDRDVGLCLCCAGPTADLDGLVCEACKPAPKRACRKCGFGPLSVLNEASVCGRCAATP